MENKRISQFQISLASLQNVNITAIFDEHDWEYLFPFKGGAIYDSSLVQDDL